jgi:glycosyltransferase involved in cell wall biosynthesis
MIFETDCAGHRLQYVRSIIDALREAGVSDVLFVTSPGVVESPEYRTHLQDVGGSLTIDASSKASLRPASLAALSRFIALRKSVKQYQPDHVYVPYGDGLIQVSGVANLLSLCWRRKNTIVEGLLMRGGYAYPVCGALEKLKGMASLWSLGWSPFDVIHQLDPFAFEYVKMHRRRLFGRCRLIPEAVEQIQPIRPEVAREMLKVDVDGRYLGCLGWLDTRKGVDLLIRSFASARLRANDRLLLMGNVDPQIQCMLDGEFATLVQEGRIVVIKGYVSQEAFHLGFSAADVLVAPYPRHIGSSGIVVRAASIGKPILGSNFGWIGAVIQDFGLGWICNVQDCVEFSKTIEHAMEHLQNYRPSESGAGFARYHTLENFKLHWTRQIRQRLGKKVTPKLVCWDSNGLLRPFARTRR